MLVFLYPPPAPTGELTPSFFLSSSPAQNRPTVVSSINMALLGCCGGGGDSCSLTSALLADGATGAAAASAATASFQRLRHKRHADIPAVPHSWLRWDGAASAGATSPLSPLSLLPSSPVSLIFLKTSS